MKNIVILGGGTAGWITALFVKSIFQEDNVTVIQSKEIGIIGVGEATTPNVISLLKWLNIDLTSLVKECDVTIKNGISFENWNGDNKKYFHGFKEEVSDFKIDRLFLTDCFDYYLKNLIKDDLSLNEYVYQTKLAYANKIDLNRTSWSIHFNANKLSDFLQKNGESRGIKVIDGNYRNCLQDKCGFIKNIYLENQRNIDCDFVFDCTGFNRLLIGKLYNQRWISYSKHLPMKKAIPFWLESDKDFIKPYTSCVAMKYGWIWKIPLQSRIGSGYVFDSNYIDEEQALTEAEEYYGKKLEIRKIIEFDAGKYENFWVKNCMAVGLSSSFIEPLESTSLFLTVGQLNLIKAFVNEIFNPSDSSIKLFNEIVSNNMEDTMNFVYLHYMTKRKDSDFWKDFRKNNIMPDKLRNIFEKIKSSNLKFYDLDNVKTPTSFTLSSYLQVCFGLELFETKFNNQKYENTIPSTQEYKLIINNLFEGAPDHKEFINQILS